jgi:hypothetical protein
VGIGGVNEYDARLEGGKRKEEGGRMKEEGGKKRKSLGIWENERRDPAELLLVDVTVSL